MTRSMVRLATTNAPKALVFLQQARQRGRRGKSICSGDQVCVATLESGVFTPLQVTDQYYVAPDSFSRRNNKK